MKFEKFLLAEDDREDYLSLMEGLHTISPGCIVVRAKNGLDCITLLKKGEKPDVIFLDLNMPIKSGIDCLKFIKDNDALANIPVVIYSTSHYIKDIDACFKNGCHYYIVKPSDEHQLLQMLQIVRDRLNNSLQVPSKTNFVVRVSTAFVS